MFSWYKYLNVVLFFSRLGFWSGNLFLIAPFPDRCLLVPFSMEKVKTLDLLVLGSFVAYDLKVGKYRQLIDSNQ